MTADKRKGYPPLKLSEIPDPDGDWDAIRKFAMTFNGYDYWGSLKSCADVANKADPQTINEARTCLFFEFRRERFIGNTCEKTGETDDGHNIFELGYELTKEDENYRRDLVRNIRRAIEKGSVNPLI